MMTTEQALDTIVKPLGQAISNISTTDDRINNISSTETSTYLRYDNSLSFNTRVKDSVGDSINDLEAEIKMLKENMSRQLNITMLHGCRNCGGRVNVDINKPVFHCPYCGTPYLIGTAQINSTY